jgi:threonine/homoserine/homoserine lactone efflux protein
MISVDSILVFISASALLCAVPGPDNIFVLTQSALYGKASGVLVTLGLCTGLMVHTTAVALGVATLFQASTIAFTALKWVGAMYLLYLAWRAFRAPANNVDVPRSNLPTAGALYRRGIIMNVTNPKVSIFFLAFLPQFYLPDNGSMALQIFQLGGLFIVTTLMIFGVIALLAGRLGGWLSQSRKTQVYLNRVAGAVFVLLALKLILSRAD